MLRQVAHPELGLPEVRRQEDPQERVHQEDRQELHQEQAHQEVLHQEVHQVCQFIISFPINKMIAQVLLPLVPVVHQEVRHHEVHQELVHLALVLLELLLLALELLGPQEVHHRQDRQVPDHLGDPLPQEVNSLSTFWSLFL